MVDNQTARLDRIFGALSDGTRREMLKHLSRKEATVSELAAPFDMSLAAISKHLKVLEAAEFVERTKSGRMYRCRARLEPLDEVTQLLEELGSFWRERLEALEVFLADSTQHSKPKRKLKKERR